MILNLKFQETTNDKDKISFDIIIDTGQICMGLEAGLLNFLKQCLI